jgi:hypothetical protein
MSRKASLTPSHLDPVNEIWPNLFVGSKRAAMNAKFLSKLYLVVNCAADEVACYSDVGGTTTPLYYLIAVKDDCTENSIRELYDHFDQVTLAIHKCLSMGQSCFIHCHLGAQRSCAVAAAYLMRYQGMTRSQSIEYIKSKRSIAFYGSIHFQKALKMYEEKLSAQRKMQNENNQKEQEVACQKVMSSFHEIYI